MSFLTTNDGGDFLPYIQWGSDAVQWTRKTEIGKEVFQPTTAIFDLENLKVGWMKISVGQAPDKIFTHYREAAPERPTEKAKNKKGDDVFAYNKGFCVNVLFGKEMTGERLYEFSSSQKGSLEAVAGLLETFEAEKDTNQGKVPVVTFSGHTYKKMGQGSTNIPNLSITSWVARPAELDAGGSSEPTPVAQAPTPTAPPAGGVSEF